MKLTVLIFPDGNSFSYITETGRIAGSSGKMELFSSKIRPYLYNAKRLLDVGTGGGEKLSRFAPFTQRNICNRRRLPQAKCGNSKETLSLLEYR